MSSERSSACRLARFVLLGLVAVAVGACKSVPPPPPPPKPIDVQVQLVSAPDLNPNPGGRASPVFLRIFQLRDASKFLNGAFDDLTLRSETALAASVISREERMVQPGTDAPLPLKIDPETRLLGVVAEYRDLANSQWRATSPAPPGGLLNLFKDQRLTIRLERLSVSVSASASPGGK